jgi:uncharacterized surface anchored protein
MPGYESLVTDGEGIIPRLDNNLPAGTYELREKSTVEGYETLAANTRFTVSDIGAITLGTHPEGVTLTGEPDQNGTIEYVLSIPNSQRKKVSFMKVDIGSTDKTLSGAEFDLYEVNVDGETETRVTPPLYSGLTSGENGLLADGSGNTVFELPVGIYHLVETQAPDGYYPATEAVKITVTASDVSYDEGTVLSESGRGRSYDVATKTYTLKISNSTGYALPASGGIGTTIFYVLGSMLVFGCGVVLIARRRMGIRK